MNILGEAMDGFDKVTRRRNKQLENDEMEKDGEDEGVFDDFSPEDIEELKNEIKDEVGKTLEEKIKPMRGLLVSIHKSSEEMQTEKLIDKEEINKILESVRYISEDLERVAIVLAKDLPKKHRERIREYHTKLIEKYEGYTKIMRAHKKFGDSIDQLTEKYDNSKDGRINMSPTEKSAEELINEYKEYKIEFELLLHDTIKPILVTLGEFAQYLEDLVLASTKSDDEFKRNIKSARSKVFMAELQYGT